MLPEGTSLERTPDRVDEFVARIEDAYELPINEDSPVVEQYRDLFTMLSALNSVAQAHPDRSRQAMSETVVSSELPIKRYADCPFDAEQELLQSSERKAVAELLGDAIDAADGADYTRIRSIRCVGTGN